MLFYFIRIQFISSSYYFYFKFNLFKQNQRIKIFLNDFFMIFSYTVSKTLSLDNNIFIAFLCYFYYSTVTVN